MIRMKHAVAIAVFSVAACSPQDALLKDAQEAVKRQLDDPSAPLFDRQMPPMVFPKQGLVCGTVNAKNQYGAYGGDRLFAYSRAEGAIIGDPSSPSSWDRYRALQRQCLQASENELAKMQGRPPKTIPLATDGELVRDTANAVAPR